MKKQLLLTIAIFFATLFGVKTTYGCTILTTAVPSVPATLNQAVSTAMSVAYNPNKNLYYTVNGGFATLAMQCFDGTSGALLTSVVQNIDYRGCWWNTNTNQFEGNAYGSPSALDAQNLAPATGYPLTTFTSLGVTVPSVDGQRMGVYDPVNNYVIFINGLTLQKYNRNTGALVATVNITGLPATTINTYSALYTGCTGYEYGVYDYSNKRLYFLNTSGAYQATCNLPASAPGTSFYGIAFANGYLWLNDAGSPDYIWKGYQVFNSSPCAGTPTAAHLVSSTAFVTPCNNSFTITASAYDNIPGIALQLQSSSSPTGPWTNVTGGYVSQVTNATTTFTVTNLTSTTYYRLVDTCINVGLTSISNIIVVGLELTCGCLAPPYYNNGGCLQGANFVGFNSFSVTGECGSAVSYTSTGCVNNGYSDLSGTLPILKVYPGHSYLIAANVPTLGVTQGAIGAWLDYNSDGVFAGPPINTEQVGGFTIVNGQANYSSNTCINAGGAYGVCISTGTPVGFYRMRLRFTNGPYTLNTIDPCTVYGNGQTIDIAVQVVPLPPASASVSPNPVCTNQCAYFTTPTYTLTPGSVTYSWTGPANFTSTQANPVLCGAQTYMQGTYTVNAIVNSVSTCQGATTTLTVSTTPVPTISPAGPVTLCAPACQLLSGNTGPFHYQWLLNGAPITGATTQGWQACVSGTYTLVDSVSSDACWGTSATPVVVNINPVPTAGFALTGNNPICLGQCTTILFTGTNNAKVYYTRNGILDSVTLNNSGSYLLTVCPTVTTAYALSSVTDMTSGCVGGASGIITINVNPLPTAGITGITPTTMCQGGCAVFTVTGTPNTAGSYTLSPGGVVLDTILASGTRTFTVCPTNTTTISLGTITNLATGCSATPVSTITLTVNPLPTATISGPSSFCAGSCFTFTLTGTPGATVTYNQTGLGGSQISPAIGITGTVAITICPTVTTTISLLSATNPATGCSQAINGSITVTMQPIPTAAVAVTGANPICSGSCTTLSFTGTANDTVFYSATPGGNAWIKLSAGGTGTVSVCPTATTVYSVTSVKDPVTGCIGNPASSATVTVNALPTAALTGAASICTGLCTTMTITGTPNSVATYTWAPGGIPQHVTIPVSGIYTFVVCPTVTTIYSVTKDSLASTGCFQTLNSTQTVTVGQAPNIFITGGTTICSGSCTTLVILGGPGSAGDQVTYNDGTNHTVTLTGNPGTYNITACPAATTTYSLVSVTTPVGCTFNISGSTVVTVTPSPTATATPQGSTEICQGGVVVLNGFAGVGYTYQWWSVSPAIAIPGATNATYITGTAGSYYIVESLGSCAATSNTVTVTVDNVQATITSNTPTSFCIGGSVTLNAPTGAGYLYQWLQDGSAIPGATTSSYTTSTAGSYQVAVTNSIGCGNTSAVTVVSVHPMPTANLTTTGALSFCPGDSVVITTDTGTGYTYQWSHPSGVIAGATNVSYTTYTSDTIAVTVTSAYGCVTNSNPLDSVRTTRNASPTAGITLSGPSTVCFNQSVNLTATTDIGTAFQWYYDGAPIPGANTQIYNAFVTGTYGVVVTSPAGCKTAAATNQYILVEPQPFVTTGNPVVFCQGNSAQLTVNTGNIPGSPTFTTLLTTRSTMVRTHVM
jgi:hypothetical protein